MIAIDKEKLIELLDERIIYGKEIISPNAKENANLSHVAGTISAYEHIKLYVENHCLDIEIPGQENKKEKKSGLNDCINCGDIGKLFSDGFGLYTVKCERCNNKGCSFLRTDTAIKYWNDKNKLPELKPCPWCNLSPSLVHGFIDWWVAHDNEDNNDCPIERVVTLNYNTKLEAIEAWNKRA